MNYTITDNSNKDNKSIIVSIFINYIIKYNTTYSKENITLIY